MNVSEGGSARMNVSVGWLELVTGGEGCLDAAGSPGA